MVKRITLVKARPEPREATMKSLVAAGFDVEAHDTGEAALAAIRERPPDVLITDISLVGIGGAELAARARTSCPGGRLYVIGLAERGDAAPPSAFDVVLTKPVEIDSLLDLLGA